MKYVLIDKTRGDQFTKEFDNLEQALKQSEIDFAHKTLSDHCTEFYLLESANPDEEAENHFDGNVIKRWK